MRIDISTETGVTTVCPHGALNAESSPPLHDALVQASDSGASVVSLDLSSTPVVTSAGLEACCRAASRVRQLSKLRIVGMQPRVSRLFDLSGLLRLVEL